MRSAWFTVIAGVICGITVADLPWSWDTIALWADLGTQNTSLFTEYQSKFAAETYDIISIEKCLGNTAKTNITTEEAFLNISSQMRKYASPNETKILMYFAADCAYCKCYDITDEFCNNKSMWLTDDYGNYVFNGNNPYYDHTQQYVRDWWANTVTSMMNTAINKNIIINGIFVDGASKNFSSNNKNFSNQRALEWNNGLYSVMNETKKLFTNINDDLYIIANAIATYSNFAPEYGMQILPYVDGVLHGHFGSFEEVIGGNKGNGKLNTSLILWAFNISQAIANGDYGQNKSLWIKAWIGPQGSPMAGTQPVHGPTWPIGYGITPNTSQGIQEAATKLITYPLALYLCGIYNKYTYFGYAWFWDILQGWIPCPDDPTSCDCPIDFYKEFAAKLGKPKSNGIMTDTFKCNRSFEYANVYVDIQDNVSAIIDWL
eukprot:365794_1